MPRVYKHYETAESEYPVIEKMPGTTLEKAWPTLDMSAKVDIANEVVGFLTELRALRYPYIKAALPHRKPLRRGLIGTADFNEERFGRLPSDECISAYVQARTGTASAQAQPNLCTHGDLDWSNILVVDNKVSGIIDWETGGYFPDYWEWVTLKSSAEAQGSRSWSHLLASRLESSFESTKWNSMWELEQLHQALAQYARWGLTPEDREENRTDGWADVSSIVGQESMPAPVDYSISSRHPFWLEKLES